MKVYQPLHMLQVANVCHPDMDPHERWRTLLEVAVARNMTRWETRLRRHQTASPMLAMQILTAFEKRSVVIESWTPEEKQSVMPMCTHIMLWILLLCMILIITLTWFPQKKCLMVPG